MGMQDAEAGDRPCYLWVTGTPFYDEVDDDGNPLNNPDNTLYPGDKFRYQFIGGFSKHTCSSKSILPVSERNSVQADDHTKRGGKWFRSGTASILIPEANDCHGGGSNGARGYGGEDGWRTKWGDSKNCGKLSVTVKAREWHCSDDGDCYSFWKYRTASITPRVVAPVVEVGLIEHILQDPEMYMAANRDYTNYPWDPIAIEHIAHFKHRDAREGTITFDYVRPHDLVEEGGYECDAKCNETLRVDGGFRNATGIGFLPYPHTSYSGGGMYAYTGEDLNSTGLHDIIYDVTVLNEGQMINTHTNNTEQLIVNYDPQFEHYEYTVLKDGHKYAYDDRIGMAIHYLGSEGSGPDDEDILHEDRRTKINDFEPTTTSYSELLNFTDLEIDPELLKWNNTGVINGTDPDGWVSKGETAMFEDEGYGIIRLHQNITNIIFEQDRQEGFYHNTTVKNNITTVAFAGHDRYELFNYTYQYPDAPFAQFWNVTSYHPDGMVADDALSISAYPANVTHNAENIAEITDENKTIYLDEYLYAKALYDTGDEHFAEAMKNSTYSMTNDAEGKGHLSMWFNKTALHFTPLFFPSENFTITYLNTTGPNGTSAVSSGSLVDIIPISRNDILAIGRYTALDLDAIMRIDMEAINHVRTLEESMDFTFPHSEIVNLQSGNKLDVVRLMATRATSSVQLNVTDYFGDIKTATIGLLERDFREKCVISCVVYTDAGTTITLTNAWGGTAEGRVNSTDSFNVGDGPKSFANIQDYLLFLGANLIIVFILYMVFKNYMKNRGEE